MQSLCSYPIISTTFRSCDTILTNRTVWAAIPLLLGAQATGLEQVLNQTDDHVDIVMDLSETRISSLDLAILVQSSTLENRDQISTMIHKLADDALDLNRALQVFAAKVGAGFDRIISMNDHLYRVLRSSSASNQNCHIGALPQGIDDCLLRFQYPDIGSSYDRTLMTYETVLHDLLQSSIASLLKATVFDADLVSVLSVIGGERLEIDLAKGQLGSLWNFLGANNHRLSRLARNEHVLNRVGEYSFRALRYLQSVQDSLENMQRQLEELKLVALGGLISEVSSPEVVLEMLARGLERMGSVRISGAERKARLLDGP
ncbi:hypothetical protein FOMPIDRAFT_93845 [Fomitopsis schrenkii]|uniref:Uncharacterized protein n=1 Tax=Fomitopsis schrenkii TaxID=2126942 RepID=S8F2W8_FOMSC|nr:hypothetical protein FOMPIDRAFT_93845 [Fomitopsis schrenkii]